MLDNLLINYPVWDLGFLGGGTLIAFMAVIHVYVAHFAVGGGLFLVLTEIKGYRENSEGILDYTRKHTKFFLLVTMVFGAITGVGIWFTISLLSPAATSILVHNFVFGWATEWVFFLGEIVALFVYFYTFGKMNKRDHLRMGWLYFVFGWLSLFIINGIITFMLTPGKWISSGSFWDGFFNPSFWPSLFFRTFMALMLAGLFGFVTSSAVKEKELRESLEKYCAKWLIIPFILLLASVWWYIGSLPEPQKLMILKLSPEIPPVIKLFLLLSPLIFTGGVFMALRMHDMVKKGVVAALLVAGVLYIGSFEWIREAGRRPYIIYDSMYSNSVSVKDLNFMINNGILKTSRWVASKKIDETNQLQAGREIFKQACLSCHSEGGLINDIRSATKKYSQYGMESMLHGMGKVNEYMPPFPGNHFEKKALAAFIVKELNGKKEDVVSKYPVNPVDPPLPSFDPARDEYLLLAWSGKGMHFISDNDQFFSVSQPGSTIHAQLIKRGKSPVIVTSGVIVTYRMEDGFTQPSSASGFWQYSKSFYGHRINDNEGISGKKTSGEMEFDGKLGAYSAADLPVIPYSRDGSFMPFPVVYIEARDYKTKELLCATGATVPVSTEMGCRNCHGGNWGQKNITGFSKETALDILKTHDRINRTDLEVSSRNGNPKMCSSCHPGERTVTGYKSGQLNLSAAIHGFHANYIAANDPDPCANCHPSSGFTNSYRGVHMRTGLDCSSCHGKMEDHALSLLVSERNQGKSEAERLMKHIRPRSVDNFKQIEPRKAWVNQPDCLNCHVNFSPPDTDQSPPNVWTKERKGLYSLRADDAGIMCPACHGVTHAEYPATNIFGNNRDNFQPLQYQKNNYPVGANKNCRVCHTVDMKEEIHHPNMLAIFRNIN